MKTPHTAGPYRWEQRGDSLSLIGHAQRLVLRIDSGVIPMNPDARLLRAAPELLAAFDSLVSELSERTHEDGRMMSAAFVRGEVCHVSTLETARSVIRKAKGEA